VARQPSADLGRLWLSGEQRRILGALEHAVLHGGGLLVVTGDVGVGKTTLASALVAGLADRAIVARLPHPSVDARALIEILGRSLGLEGADGSRARFLRGVRHAVHVAEGQDKRVLIVADEAQDLAPDALGEFRQLLLSLDAEPLRSGLSLLLVGQDDLLPLLGDSDTGLQRFVSLHERIPALADGEVADFLRHRLQMSGPGSGRFTADAIRAIEAMSGGIPRVADTLCDVALMGPPSNKPVDARTVRERAERFGVLPAFPPDAPEPIARDGRKTHGGKGVPAPANGGAAAAAVATRRASVAARDTRTASRSRAASRRLWGAGLAALAIGLAVGIVVIFVLTSPGARRTETAPETPSRSASQERTAVPAPPAPPSAPLPDSLARSPAAPSSSTASRSSEKSAPAVESGARRRADSPPKSSSGSLAKPSAVQRAPAPAATAPPRTSEARPDAPDPNAIIDWVLRESPARR
jgi:general secretion pathway protein A